MSKFLIILSSHRQRSNSSALAAAVAEGLTAAGVEVETVDLARLKIFSCLGCGSCQKPGSTGCGLKDDMAELYPKLKAADGLVLATPVYFFNISGQLKVFVDRCYPVAAALKGKKVAGVLTYGDTTLEASGGLNGLKSLEDTCAFAGAVWKGAVHGSAMDAGVLAQDAELLKKAERFGRELAG